MLICGFKYKKDKHGKQYGWGVAEYSTPEKFMGEAFTERVYARPPEESYAKVLAHLQKLLPDADEPAIRRIL